MSKQKKSGIPLFVIIIAVVVVIGIGLSHKEVKDDVENNTTQNQVVEIVSNTTPDEETPEEVMYINLNNEDKVKCCSILGTFDDGKSLTTEQYLKVAYNALNSGYISTNKTKYTEQEIKDIVYTIFNVELSENKSIEGLKYEGGIYTLEKQTNNKQQFGDMISDVAAGSVYIMYEMDGTNYIAKLTTNGVTSETYISSIIEG